MNWSKEYASKIKDHRFLVTGGAGFIGSHIVEYLLSSGAELVRTIDNLSTGDYKNVKPFETYPNFEYIEGDIRSYDTCQKACESIDYVLHQAALGSVPRSIKDPITTNEVNITGFLNMIMAARDRGVKKFIYAASSSTYGDNSELPKMEHKIGNPLSPYAITKYVNELYAKICHGIYRLPTIGLRYFNVFGPRQNPDGPYAAVIPLFILNILEGKQSTINGDGSISRDFTFVENAVQANIRAAFSDDKFAQGNVYNVACGKSTSLNNLYDVLKSISNSQIDCCTWTREIRRYKTQPRRYFQDQIRSRLLRSKKH